MAEVQLLQQRELADVIGQRGELVLREVQGAQQRRQGTEVLRKLVQLPLRQLQRAGLLRGLVVLLQAGVAHVT